MHSIALFSRPKIIRGDCRGHGGPILKCQSHGPRYFNLRNESRSLPFLFTDRNKFPSDISIGRETEEFDDLCYWIGLDGRGAGAGSRPHGHSSERPLLSRSPSLSQILSS